MISHSTASNPSSSRGSCDQSVRQLLFFVETGDLDDELHVGTAGLVRWLRAPSGSAWMLGNPWASTVAGEAARTMDSATGGPDRFATWPTVACRSGRSGPGGRSADERALERPATESQPSPDRAGRCCCWPRSGCGCGGSSRVCRTATTPTRRAITCLGRSRTSPMTTTRTTSSTRRPTPTCSTSCSSCGSGQPMRSASAYAAAPDRGVRAGPGGRRGTRHALRVAHLPRGRADVQPHRRAGRGGDLRPGVPAPIFYSHLALNDAPTLAPAALSLYGTAGVLRNGARRDYVLAGNRLRCGGGDQVHRRDHVRLPAGRVPV